jgi:hypothetical protein
VLTEHVPNITAESDHRIATPPKRRSARLAKLAARLGISRIGVLRKMFGCRHREMSRPMTMRDRTVCLCFDCGAYRNFNTESFTLEGKFYYSIEDI